MLHCTNHSHLNFGVALGGCVAVHMAQHSAVTDGLLLKLSKHVHSELNRKIIPSFNKDIQDIPVLMRAGVKQNVDLNVEEQLQESINISDVAPLQGRLTKQAAAALIFPVCSMLAHKRVAALKASGTAKDRESRYPSSYIPEQDFYTHPSVHSPTNAKQSKSRNKNRGDAGETNALKTPLFRPKYATTARGNLVNFVSSRSDVDDITPSTSKRRMNLVQQHSYPPTTISRTPITDTSKQPNEQSSKPNDRNAAGASTAASCKTRPEASCYYKHYQSSKFDWCKPDDPQQSLESSAEQDATVWATEAVWINGKRIKHTQSKFITLHNKQRL